MLKLSFMICETVNRNLNLPRAMTRCPVIRSVTAKGRNAQEVQEKFNAIIKEAKLKLLDTTIEALRTNELEEQEASTVH